MVPKVERNLNFIPKFAVRICNGGCDIAHIFLYLYGLIYIAWRKLPVNFVT